MKEKWKKILQTLKDAPTWLLVVTYIVTVLSVAAALTMLFVGYKNSLLLSILAYLSFALAAISLSFTVYTLVRFAPRIKKGIIEWLQSFPLVATLMKNYDFRTVVFTGGSFLFNIAYSVFNGVIGVVYRSPWYGALAAYYVLFTLLRGGVLLSRKREGNEDESYRRARLYRNCGILVLVLDVALSSAIAQMIFDDKGFSYAGWTIYAFAAYAFWKVGMAIYNAIKAQKRDDMTVRAIRHSNLVSATVSILALQTALLSTFSDEGVNVSLYNTITGCFVSAFGLFIGVYMIINGGKVLKKIREEQIRYGE